MKEVLIGHIDLTPILDQLEGCSDGYCDVRGKAAGMHTNGGCRCLDWLTHFYQQKARIYFHEKRESIV